MNKADKCVNMKILEQSEIDFCLFGILTTVLYGLMI